MRLAKTVAEMGAAQREDRRGDEADRCVERDEAETRRRLLAEQARVRAEKCLDEGCRERDMVVSRRQRWKANGKGAQARQTLEVGRRRNRSTEAGRVLARPLLGNMASGLCRGSK